MPKRPRDDDNDSDGSDDAEFDPSGSNNNVDNNISNVDDDTRPRQRARIDNNDSSNNARNDNNDSDDAADEDGEDLEDGVDMFNADTGDYRRIDALDTYEGRDIDNRDYGPVDWDARRAADEVIEARENAAAGIRGRVPMALRDGDGEEDLGDDFLARRRRRLQERAALGGVDYDEDEEIFNLEDYNCPLREWLTKELPRREIKRRFFELLTKFQTENSDEIYVQRIKEMCAANLQSLDVSYIHISQAEPILAIWLADAPTPMFELFNEVAKEVVLTQFPDYEDIHNEVYVRIHSLPVSDSLRDLRQVHLNALVKVTGVITRRTGVFPQVKRVKWKCLQCRYVMGPFDVRPMESPDTPGSCPECNGSGFSVDEEGTLYRNYQKITLQESPGSVPAGRVPRHKEVILLADMVDTAKPGEEVEITGVYTNYFDKAMKQSSGFPVFCTVINANHMVGKQEMDAANLTEEDIQDIRRLSRDKTITNKILKAMAPSIYGQEHSKMALAMALFGGREKVGAKHRIRGDINVLMLGDPGTAKSQFLKFAEKTAPRAVYTTGKGASAVGLTASVHKDHITGEWTLEGGALVLADRGVCLIDEFDKMGDSDRVSIHEAMEQQSISISKAGIVATLQARCSVIAAANPIGGRYDASHTLTENVELTDPILQRFDIISVMQDLVDPMADERLARFVTTSHMKAHPSNVMEYIELNDEMNEVNALTQDPQVVVGYDEEGNEIIQEHNHHSNNNKNNSNSDDHHSNNNNLNSESSSGDGDATTTPSLYQGDIPQELFKKYIMFARTRCHPQLLDIDQDKIATLYKELRKESSIAGGVPIAVRHIESMMRMSEAHARMHLRDYVRDDDVDAAIRTMLTSFFQAQKFSVKKQLQQTFAKYLHKESDSHELLLYILQQLVKDAMTYKRLKQRIQLVQDTEIVIRAEELSDRAREVSIFQLDDFYRSDTFKKHGFSLLREGRTLSIVKSFAGRE